MTEAHRTCPSCSGVVPAAVITCPSCGALSLPEDRDPSAGIAAILRGTLGQRYRVEREIGQGGMAIVYLAHDFKHNRPVAIKVMRPELALILGAPRFLREIRIAAQLNHPGILPLYDSGEAGGLLYYVMPYGEGQTLRAGLAAGPLPVPEAIRIAQEIADALAYAHEQGVVHRDIKPDNVLLLAHGHAAITDFGIARALAGVDAAVTTTGVRIGSPAYMSPEQFSGAEVGPRADIYALGCLTYEMLTGSPPYEGADTDALMKLHCTAPVPSARSRRPEVPAALDLAVRRAMAKQPADRFAGASALGAALGASRLDLRAALGMWRRSWVGRALAAAAAVLIVAAAVWGLRARRAPAPRLRLAIMPLSTEDAAQTAAGRRFAERLAEELGAIPGLLVTAPQRPAQILQGRFWPGGPGALVSLQLLDAGSRLPLGPAMQDSAAGSPAGADSLARRLGLTVRSALARYADSLRRRARYGNAEAWRLAERAREERRAVEAALVAGAVHVATAALDRSDSLLRLAIRLEPGDAPRIQLAANVDFRAFAIEFLRQRSPDAAGSLPDPVPIRRSALRMLDSIIVRDTLSAVAYALRGSIEAGLHRLEGGDTVLAAAIRDLSRATALDAHNTSAWATLAQCYGDNGEFQDELFAYRQAAQADQLQLDRQNTLRGIFDAALVAGDVAAARDACRSGIAEGRASDALEGCELKLLARTAANESDGRRALVIMDSLAQIDHNKTTRALNRLYAADALARAGRYAEADRQAARVEADYRPAGLPSVLLEEMAIVRLLRHQPDSALALARKALLQDPGSRSYLLNSPDFAALRPMLSGRAPSASHGR